MENCCYQGKLVVAWENWLCPYNSTLPTALLSCELDIHSNCFANVIPLLSYKVEVNISFCHQNREIYRDEKNNNQSINSSRVARFHCYMNFELTLQKCI